MRTPPVSPPARPALITHTNFSFFSLSLSFLLSVLHHTRSFLAFPITLQITDRRDTRSIHDTIILRTKKLRDERTNERTNERRRYIHDIPPLHSHFLEEKKKKYKKQVTTFRRRYRKSFSWRSTIPWTIWTRDCTPICSRKGGKIRTVAPSRPRSTSLTSGPTTAKFKISTRPVMRLPPTRSRKYTSRPICLGWGKEKRKKDERNFPNFPLDVSPFPYLK